MYQTRRTDATRFLQNIKRCFLSLLGLILLLLVVYNGFSAFCVSVSFPLKSPPQPAPISLQILRRETMRKKVSHFSSPPRNTRLPASSSSSSFAVSKNQLRPNASSTSPTTSPKRRIQKKHTNTYSETLSKRISEFLSTSSCEPLFFMTWISSIESFGDRELFSIESLFKSHQSGCLLLISDSLDSRRGRLILKPFWDKGFKVMAIKPDLDLMFKDTSAERWFDGLKKGKFNPGVIPLEQNLSNLLRLVLLYKYGGIYLDTDVIILKSLTKMRNAIGAQTIDYATRQWSRLNNAVLIFDKKHPLLKEFIDEFAFTFNGNKWGHNGPYLVSRVVARIWMQRGLNFTVLPPSAFYPVDWNRIGGFYRAPANESEAKWLRSKLESVRRQSSGVHLWNRESRKLRIEEGSIIHHILSDCCIFCNSSLWFH